MCSMRGSRTIAVAAAVAALLGVAGCGGREATSPAAAQDVPASVEQPVAVDAATIVIDVRTPEEFSQGHLDGAVNLDVEGGAFEQGLTELDPAGSYIVYCRSGRRSAHAAALMAERGFADVVDLGSLEQAASATGLPLVTD